MKIRFKKQAFQDSAVQSVVECFEGQSRGESQFTFDYKRLNLDDTLFVNDEFDRTSGTANPPIGISELDVLENIKRVQGKQNLPISDGLAGQYNLTIEMETGTGKTYVYIKTMFELYQKYGWGKFVVVVPSVAIREGVYKSFQLMEEHFMETYGMKARYFIYNSQRLTDVASFARDRRIQVLIINSQAFAAKGKDGKIYVAITNIDPKNTASLDLSFAGQTIAGVKGETLYASAIDAVNSILHGCLARHEGLLNVCFRGQMCRAALQHGLPSRRPWRTGDITRPP